MINGYIRQPNRLQMRRRELFTIPFLGVALLTGCYPETPDSIDEYDLVYTNYAPAFDFKAEGTYALPDSVVKITGNLAEGDSPEMVNPIYGDQILNRIRNNMADYGWTEVAEGDDPDVLVLPSVITSTTVSVWYPSYWGWYYPWYGGWYYPGYYPPSVSSYSTGSLIVQMSTPTTLALRITCPWCGYPSSMASSKAALRIW